MVAELEKCAVAVRESEPAESLGTIGAAMDRLIGSRMLTFLRFDFERFEMERLYCTQPERYPIGARKPMRRGPWSRMRRRARHRVHRERRPRRCARPSATTPRWQRLGCTATMCVPVRHRGRTLGTMNLNGDEGRYGEREAALAQPFATLAVPAYLAAGVIPP